MVAMDQEKSVIEKLIETSPGLEVWWDSSPLVYKSWETQMLNNAGNKREKLAEQLIRLFDPMNPSKTEFRGVTTNPPLSLAAMKDNPVRWQEWIRTYMIANPNDDAEKVFWALYKEIVRLGADSFLPVYERSAGLHGHLSGQIDPRNPFKKDLMLKQALEIANLGRNIMVKIPGSAEGIDVIRDLTSRGISTNMTAGFVVPQFYLVAEAVEKGLQEARKKGVDLSGWKSVVTYMSYRWENSSEFDENAREVGVKLTPDLRRLAGVAIFKQACKFFASQAYASKMLICSVRMGPELSDGMHCWHLEETAGANAVFTLPPSFLSELFLNGDNFNFEPCIYNDIPVSEMNKLTKIPYFLKAFEPDGYSVDEVNFHPSFISNYQEFSKAADNMVQFVKERMLSNGPH